MAETQSLARGLKILDHLANSPGGRSVSELAVLLDIDKSSASRLAATLANYGFAEKDQTSHLYNLGPKVVVLSRSLLSRIPLREVAKPFLRALMESTGECAHVGIFSQSKVLYIDQVESPASLRVNADIGSMAPLHCTALGKVLLAFGRIPLPDDLEKFTEATLTSKEALKKNLEIVRTHGYAVDDEEYDKGVRCIASPIFDYRDKVVGSIGISGPVTRMTSLKMETFAPQVVKISQLLSEKLIFIKK